MHDFLLDYLRAKGAKPRRISAAKGGEWCSPCPVCGGDDRFRSWPNQEGGAACQQAGLTGTWWCRRCDKGGDLIDLLMYAEGLDFAGACRELRIDTSKPARRIRLLRQPRADGAWEPRHWEMPSAKWRAQATKMATEAHGRILESAAALHFLAGRGLPRAAVEQYRLGLFEGEDKSGTCLYRPRAAFGLPDKLNSDGTKVRKTLWLPRGVVIPLWAGQEVHRLRIRRRAGDLRVGESKFILLEGSGQAPMVLPPASVAPARAVWVIVEAELDAMAVHHACGGEVGVMASLTNLGKPDALAHAFLRQSPLILVALDFDPPDKDGKRPGAQGWAWWQKQYPNAQRWPVPVGKDPGEAYGLGLNLAAWVRAALPEAGPSPMSSPMPSPGPAQATEAGQGGGSLGAYASGLPAGGGGQRPHQNNGPRQARRWQGATPDMPPEDVQLPEGAPPLSYLQTCYAGKGCNDAGLLMPCPATRTPWHWVYYQKECLRCRGHAECIIEFILSLVSAQQTCKPDCCVIA
ncbi:primase-helicase zinc-binding domain-containing protein [Megalodesulfovibrio paquesii]